MTMSPSGLHTHPDATTAESGVIELATDAEVIAGTDAERAVTPASLDAWAGANPATETDRGLIELVTDAEVVAGTDTERAVTPASLTAWGTGQFAQYTAVATSDMTLSPTTWQLLSMGQVTANVGSASDASIVNGKLVLAKAGWYHVIFASYLRNASGNLIMDVEAYDANDVKINYHSSSYGNAVSTKDLSPTTSVMWYLPAGSKLSTSLYWTGGTVIAKANSSASIVATRIGG